MARTRSTWLDGKANAWSVRTPWGKSLTEMQLESYTMMDFVQRYLLDFRGHPKPVPGWMSSRLLHSEPYG